MRLQTNSQKCLAWCFCETGNRGRKCISDSLACLWDSFPPTGLHCPASIWRFSLCVIVSCFVLLGSPLSEAALLKRKWRWSRSRGEERVGESEEEWKEGGWWWERTVWEKNLFAVVVMLCSVLFYRHLVHTRPSLVWPEKNAAYRFLACVTPSWQHCHWSRPDHGWACCPQPGKECLQCKRLSWLPVYHQILCWL